MRVLFVDDNEPNRLVVKYMLEAAEAELSEADSAVAGLAMIEAHDYDLILMDLRMPGMDGLEAIRQIRARGDAKARLPVIVVTADDAPDIRAKVIAAGADDLVRKPVQMQALFDAIATVLTRGGEVTALLA